MYVGHHSICLVAPYEYPDDDAESIVSDAVYQLGVTIARIEWHWSREVPEDYNVATRDQLQAHMRDTGPDPILLVIEVDEFDTPDDVQT